MSKELSPRKKGIEKNITLTNKAETSIFFTKNQHLKKLENNNRHPHALPTRRKKLLTKIVPRKLLRFRYGHNRPTSYTCTDDMCAYQKAHISRKRHVDWYPTGSNWHHDLKHIKQNLLRRRDGAVVLGRYKKHFPMANLKLPFRKLLNSILTMQHSIHTSTNELWTKKD